MQVKKIKVVRTAEELPDLAGLKVEVTESTTRFSTTDYTTIERIRFEDVHGAWIEVSRTTSGIEITTSKETLSVPVAPPAPALPPDVEDSERLA